MEKLLFGMGVEGIVGILNVFDVEAYEVLKNKATIKY